MHCNTVQLAAENYLQLHGESWRIRSKALKMGSITMLRQAYESEITSRTHSGRLNDVGTATADNVTGFLTS